MDRWQNKVAIVTGGSAGIGAAICVELVQSGLKVVGLARRKHKIEKLAKTLETKPGKLFSVQADITKEEDILRAFDWITKNVGPVHILINNAGIFLSKTSLLDGKTEDWKSVLDTNVMGLCIATREATKIMRENNIDGHIIHINSVAGHYVPMTIGVNVYSASKFAVTALTETLRLELNSTRSKIKITSISPGYVQTEVLPNSGMEDTDSFCKNLASLQPNDVSDIVRYVLSTPPHVQIHEIIVRSNKSEGDTVNHLF